MKKKDYEKPTMQVVKLQHTSLLLLAGSVESREHFDPTDDNPFAG